MHSVVFCWSNWLLPLATGTKAEYWGGLGGLMNEWFHNYHSHSPHFNKCSDQFKKIKIRKINLMVWFKK